MGHAFRHGTTAAGVLVATIMEVANDSVLDIAALCVRVKIGNIAESMIRVISQCFLVMQNFIVYKKTILSFLVSFDFFKTPEEPDIFTALVYFFN